MRGFLLLCGLLLSGVAQAKSPGDIPDKFFSLLQGGEARPAFEYLISQLTPPDGEDVSAQDRRDWEVTRAQMKMMDIGKLRFKDLVLEEYYGPHYTRRVYVLVLSDQIARLQFQQYDIGERWQLMSFQFDVGSDEAEAKLKDDALRPAFRGQAASAAAD